MSVSTDDIKLINLKRKAEGKEFTELTQQYSPTDKDIDCNFYALDLDWFLKWKSFVLNDLNEKILPKKKILIVKNVGVIEPGQISNKNLFEKNSKFTIKNLKKGLKKVRIYFNYILVE